MKEPIILYNQADISREKNIGKSKLSRLFHQGKMQPYRVKGRKTNFFNLDELDF
jgi:hypothetical protein